MDPAARNRVGVIGAGRLGQAMAASSAVRASSRPRTPSVLRSSAQIPRGWGPASDLCLRRRRRCEVRSDRAVPGRRLLRHRPRRPHQRRRDATGSRSAGRRQPDPTSLSRRAAASGDSWNLAASGGADRNHRKVCDALSPGTSRTSTRGCPVRREQDRAVHRRQTEPWQEDPELVVAQPRAPGPVPEGESVMSTTSVEIPGFISGAFTIDPGHSDVPSPSAT